MMKPSMGAVGLAAMQRGPMDQPSGYALHQAKPKEEMKTMAMAGTGIMNSQIQGKGYYGVAGSGVPTGGINGVSAVGNYDPQKPSDVMGNGVGGIRGTTNLGVSPVKVGGAGGVVDQYNS